MLLSAHFIHPCKKSRKPNWPILQKKQQNDYIVAHIYSLLFRFWTNKNFQLKTNILPLRKRDPLHSHNLIKIAAFLEKTKWPIWNPFWQILHQFWANKIFQKNRLWKSWGVLPRIFAHSDPITKEKELFIVYFPTTF